MTHLNVLCRVTHHFIALPIPFSLEQGSNILPPHSERVHWSASLHFKKAEGIPTTQKIPRILAALCQELRTKTKYIYAIDYMIHVKTSFMQIIHFIQVLLLLCHLFSVSFFFSVLFCNYTSLNINNYVKIKITYNSYMEEAH